MLRTYKLNLLIALGLLLAILALAGLVHGTNEFLQENDIQRFESFNEVQPPEFYGKRADMFSTSQHIFIRGYLSELRFVRYDEDTWLMLASMDKEDDAGLITKCNMIGELSVADEAEMRLPENFAAVPVEIVFEKAESVDRVVRCRSIGTGDCLSLDAVLAEADADYQKGRVQSFHLDGKQLVPD